VEQYHDLLKKTQGKFKRSCSEKWKWGIQNPEGEVCMWNIFTLYDPILFRMKPDYLTTSTETFF
jgi:hypothetical protein